MILGKLTDSAQYEALHPAFKTLFDYVKTHDLSQVSAGRVEIDGDNLFINVSDATLKKKEEQILEVHQAYIDIHIPLSGTEIIGWKALSDLSAPDQPFDSVNDFAVYSAPAAVYTEVHPGEFVIDFPTDAHAPIIGEGKLRKLIAKVKI